MRGVEIGANVAGENLDAAEFEPLWTNSTVADVRWCTRARRRSAVPQALCATWSATLRLDAGDRQPDLRRVAERHPELVFCLHGGGFAPFQIGRWERGWQLRADLRAALPRPPSEYLRAFYFDTLTHDPASLQVSARVGWGHVVLGSDYCFDMASDDPVADVRLARARPPTNLPYSATPWHRSSIVPKPQGEHHDRRQA